VTPAELLQADPVEVAPRLLGCRLSTQFEGATTTVLINEVEAYREDDPASHSFRGRRTRNLSMFGPGGRLYVYRSYGIHWCANVVVGPEGVGAAVLLRGGVTVEGIEVMARRRGRDKNLTNGPGKLCQALGINGSHDGTDLLSDGLIRLSPAIDIDGYRTTPRVGITKAVEKPWRFVAEVPPINLPAPNDLEPTRTSPSGD